jgi:hypothetical protein
VLAVNRALQNPGLFTSDHYRQAAIAVAAGIAIRIIVAIPVRCTIHELIHMAEVLTPADCWCTSVNMDARAVHGPATCPLGREHHKWATLP